MKRGTSQLAALLAADVVLLWIGTSLFRGKGLVPFAAGLAILVWAVGRLRRGASRPLLVASFLLILGSTVVLGAEAILRLRPQILGGRAANAALGGYHDERDGIYDHDDHLGCAMRPSFQRRMYWNGHTWWHETTDQGYRVPKRTRADAVFLGDSMIYGHGLEAGETVPARFEAASGQTAANLGQQGTCLLQALMLLRSKGAPLRPKTVFVCAHPNDLKDASYWYEPDELRRFLAQDDYLPLARREFRSPEAPFAFWLRHVSLPLFTARALRALTSREANPLPSGGGAAVPSSAELDASFPSLTDGPDALGWQVQERALTRLKHDCDGLGARMVVFDLGYPRSLSSAIESASSSMGARYDPIGRRVLERALAGEKMYLSNDGHWTPLAADFIGRTLAASYARP